MPFQFQNRAVDDSHVLMVKSILHNTRDEYGVRDFRDITTYIIELNNKRLEETKKLAVSEITIITTGFLQVPYLRLSLTGELEDAQTAADNMDKLAYVAYKKSINILQKNGVTVHVIPWKNISENFKEDIEKFKKDYQNKILEDQTFSNTRKDVINEFASRYRKQLEFKVTESAPCLTAATEYSDNETIYSHIFENWGKKYTEIKDIDDKLVKLNPLTFETYPGSLNKLMNYFRTMEKMSLTWNVLEDITKKQPKMQVSKNNSPVQQSVKTALGSTSIIAIASEHALLNTDYQNNESMFRNIFYNALATFVEYDGIDSKLCFRFMFLYTAFVQQWVKESITHEQEKNANKIDKGAIFGRHSFFEFKKTEFLEENDLAKNIVYQTATVIPYTLTLEQEIDFAKKMSNFMEDFRKQTMKR